MSKSVSIAFMSFSAVLLIALVVMSLIWHSPVVIVLTVIFALLFLYSIFTLKRNWAKLQ